LVDGGDGKDGGDGAIFLVLEVRGLKAPPLGGEGFGERSVSVGR